MQDSNYLSIHNRPENLNDKHRSQMKSKVYGQHWTWALSPEAYPSPGPGALSLQVNKGGTYPVLDGDIGTKWSSIGSGTVLVDSDWALEPGKERLVLEQKLLPHPEVIFPFPSMAICFSPA